MNSNIDSDSSDNELEELEGWVKMQHTTFCNWINQNLKVVNQEVNDLSKDLRSGEKLCTLMNVLKGKSIGKIIKNPINHYAASGNIALAFQAMTQDGVKLVNIGLFSKNYFVYKLFEYLRKVKKKFTKRSTIFINKF